MKKPGVHRKGAGLFFGRGVEDSYNHFGVEKRKQRNKERRYVMQPDVSMFSWYVWGAIIVGTFLMTLIGTWLIARRWQE